MTPLFISRDLVLCLHEEQLSLFGGSAGVRDMALLESAIAQPMASFDGEYLHASLHHMAAAYFFHIVQNHPFVDGNKRTGYITALTFLEINGISVSYVPEMYEVTMAVSQGHLDTYELAEELRRFFPGT